MVLVKPGSQEQHKHKDENKAWYLLWDFRKQNNRNFSLFCSLLGSSPTLDYDLMFMFMMILMSQAWLHSFVLPFVLSLCLCLCVNQALVRSTFTETSVFKILKSLAGSISNCRRRIMNVRYLSNCSNIHRYLRKNSGIELWHISTLSQLTLTTFSCLKSFKSGVRRRALSYDSYEFKLWISILNSYEHRIGILNWRYRFRVKSK